MDRSENKREKAEDLKPIIGPMERGAEEDGEEGVRSERREEQDEKVELGAVPKRPSGRHRCLIGAKVQPPADGVGDGGGDEAEKQNEELPPRQVNNPKRNGEAGAGGKEAIVETSHSVGHAL